MVKKLDDYPELKARVNKAVKDLESDNKVSIFVDTAHSFHPYECRGGDCIHCNKTKTKNHNPNNCALCLC